MMAEHRAVGGKEGRGFAIAVAAHVLIIGLLSIQWTAGERRFDNPPMEVDLIAETAVQSTAPMISETPPDRKSVVQGKSVSVRVELGGRRIIKKKKRQTREAKRKLH